MSNPTSYSAKNGCSYFGYIPCAAHFKDKGATREEGRVQGAEEGMPDRGGFEDPVEGGVGEDFGKGAGLKGGGRGNVGCVEDSID